MKQLKSESLPLQQGLAQGGYVDDARAIHAHVGIFFTEIGDGCSCGDDPMATNAFCEMRFSIDKATAEADVTLMQN